MICNQIKFDRASSAVVPIRRSSLAIRWMAWARRLPVRNNLHCPIVGEGRAAALRLQPPPGAWIRSRAPWRGYSRP